MTSTEGHALHPTKRIAVGDLLAALDAQLPEVGEPGSNLGADDPDETDTKETTR